MTSDPVSAIPPKTTLLKFCVLSKEKKTLQTFPAFKPRKHCFWYLAEMSCTAEPEGPSLPRTPGSVVPAVFLEGSHISAGSWHKGVEAPVVLPPAPGTRDPFWNISIFLSL